MTTMLIAMSLFFLLDLNTDRIEGKVSTIHSGDTFEVTSDNGDRYSIALKGVDCPEMKQDFGAQAKEFLEELIHRREIVVEVFGKDRLRNYVGIVILDERADIRVDLLREGLAWTTEQGGDLEAFQKQAMAERKGLWNQDNPVPPWIFRRQQSMLEAKSR